MKIIKWFLFAALFVSVGLVSGVMVQIKFPDAISNLLPSALEDTSSKEMAGMDMPEKEGKAEKTPAKESEQERKILFYRNPMNPSITSPVPAKDSMGMDYVPVYADSSGSQGPPGTVKIDAVVEQNMGVRTGMAMTRQMSRNVRGYGRITYDETRTYSIHPRFSGWITDVAVSAKGTCIEKGQLLARIYSPELVSTQQDYLVALKGMRSMKTASGSSPAISPLAENASQLVAAARRRLELFGIPSAEIRRLESGGKIRDSLDVISDVSGTVIRIKAVEGLRVTPATELYGVADLSEVWILVDVYEPDFPWVRRGDPVQVRSGALPGTTLKGSVDFIYPYENSGKRTVQARIRAENPGGLLKPGMFVNVTIDTASRQALAVPSEAVLRTGTRSLVFVVRQPGMFEPRDVVTGVESEGFTEIKQGLEQGETVVLSGQFLIDSESKLREATLKMIEGSRPSEKEQGEKKEMQGMDMKARD